MSSCKSDDSYLSYQNLLYSTSPQVFREFEYIITNIETDTEEILKSQIIKLKYELVLKDIIIRKMQNDLNNLQWSHKMWRDFCNTFLR